MLCLHSSHSFLFKVYFVVATFSSQPFARHFSSFSLIVPNKQPSDGLIKVTDASKVKSFILPVIVSPLHPVYYNSLQIPIWHAEANIMGDGPELADVQGVVTFQPWPVNSYVKVTINITGLPTGKHAFHIHTFGDVRKGCQSTGSQFSNNFIGNVETKDDGSISTVFLSTYLRLFGFNGIIGRSVVIHSKPIELNLPLNADVFSQLIAAGSAFFAEENSVGPAIACGVISIARQ